MSIIVEIIKKIIDEYENHKIASILLLIGLGFGFICSGFYFFYKDPILQLLLFNPYMHLILILWLVFSLAILADNIIKTKRIKIAAILYIITIGSVVFHNIEISYYYDPIRVKVYYDEALSPTIDELNEICELVRSPKLICSVNIDPLYFNKSKNLISISGIEIGEILKGNNLINSFMLFGKYLPIYLKFSNNNLPILITNKHLYTAKIPYLISIAKPDYAILSIYNKASSFSDNNLKKYIATSIIIMSLEAKAKALNKNLIKSSSSNEYTDCLSDFYNYIQKYDDKTKNPKFCDEEAFAVETIFGKETKNLIEESFKKIKLADNY